MRIPARVVVSVLLVVLGLTGPPREVSAQQAPPNPQDAPIPIEGVTVTATREERATFEVPSAVTNVERSSIERQAPSFVTDLLRGETGVWIQQAAPGRSAVVIRGRSGRENLFLVDGIRFNNTVNQDPSLIDPYNVERIEVVRESSSTLYGSDALGGVVNIITPVPRFTTDAWEVRGRALGQFSSADLSWVTRLSLQGGKRGVAMGAGFTYQAHDDLRGGGDTGVQRPTGFNNVAADGTLFLESGGQDLLFNLQYVNAPKTPQFDQLVAGFGQTRPSSALAVFEPTERLLLHGRYRLHEPLPFVDRVQLDVAYQQIVDGRRNLPFGMTREMREDNKSGLVGLVLQLTSQWRDWMTFTYGGEVYLESVESSRIGVDVNTGAAVVQQSRFADGATSKSFGVYLQDEIRIHPRLTAILGGRFSHFNVDVPAADRGIGTELSFDDLTGSAGLVFHLVPEVNLVANAGRGFRAPGINDLSNLGPLSGNRFVVPNPDLGPEQVVTVDGGVKFNFSRFTGQLFGFYSSFTDKIEQVPTGGQTADRRIIVQNVNLSRARTFGFEAAGRLRFSNDLELPASLTYTWGEETSVTGKTTAATRMPPFNGQVGVFYRALPNVWVEPFVRFATTQDRLSPADRNDSRIDPQGTPGWATANLRVGWDINRNVQARLAILNVFDQKYREHGSGFNAAGINGILALDIRVP